METSPTETISTETACITPVIRPSFKSNFTQYQTLVFGHRGGFFGPENSMKGFRGAVQHNLEGIEFDVWLSKDEMLMILHGGSDGQLELYGLHDQRVFDWTCEELRKLDIGDGEVMPTLEELLILVQGTNMLINIELKGPLTDDIKVLYNYNLACKTAHDLVVKYGMSKNVMFSSFCPEIVEGLLKVREAEPYVIHSLKNRNYAAETDYRCLEGVQGVNLAEKYLS